VGQIGDFFGEIEAGELALAEAGAGLARYRRSVLKAAVTGELTADWRKANSPSETGADLLAHILKQRRAGWEQAELARVRAKGKTPKSDAWKSKYKTPMEPSIAAPEGLPPGWAWASMDQLASFLTSGSRGWAEHYSEQGAISIRAQNINTDKLSLNDIAHVTPPEGAEGARTKVQLHDLLITITGANVTKTAIVQQALDEAYVSQHVALLRLVDANLSSYILAYLLDESTGRGQLLRAAYGAGKPGLNLENIRTLAVPLPPLAEQAVIVAHCEEHIESQEALSATTGDARSDAARLRQSVLSAAFSGRLAARTLQELRHVA